MKECPMARGSNYMRLVTMEKSRNTTPFKENLHGQKIEEKSSKS
jgi:hypothetical protein